MANINNKMQIRCSEMHFRGLFIEDELSFCHIHINMSKMVIAKQKKIVHKKKTQY